MLIKILLSVIIGIFIYLQYSIFINSDTLSENLKAKSQRELQDFIEIQIKFNGISYLLFLILLWFI